MLVVANSAHAALQLKSYRGELNLRFALECDPRFIIGIVPPGVGTERNVRMPSDQGVEPKLK